VRVKSSARDNSVDDSAVDQPPDTVGDDEMIMLCERCCTPIAEDEPVVRYAHINRARPDGSIEWIHSYVHTTACLALRVAAHERPDTGEWDSTRGIGVHRA
jgi:hypothetical protein